MTADEVHKALALAEAATPGPWEANDASARDSGEPALVCAGRTVVAVIRFEGTDEDAPFIAAARTDVPALCDEVTKLKAEARDYEKALRAREEEVARLTGERDAAVKLAQAERAYRVSIQALRGAEEKDPDSVCEAEYDASDAARKALLAAGGVP